MIGYLQLPDARKMEVLAQAGAITGLNTSAIEKDWWVTLALKASFLTPWADRLLFKGGTSLSKSWRLIERFSEDIDLVLDRQILGFGGELSITQIKKLRKTASNFISVQFKDALQQTLENMGVDPALFTLTVEQTDVSDRDPQVLEVSYKSLQPADGYLHEKILLEIGARSLMEPASPRKIYSIIGESIPNQSFSGEAFIIPTVDPQRTFLEKLFLLHEEFSKPVDKIRYKRMSRHLYDLERLMDSDHGKAAIQNVALYRRIVAHRERYTPIRGLNYSYHSPATINFIPPITVSKLWESDYASMRTSMIYGTSQDYKQLINRLEELRNRIREVKWQ